MQLFINNWRSVLLADANASATTLSVDYSDAARLVGLGTGDHYVITVECGDAMEVMHVTAVSGALLEVKRAQEGTIALDLSVGDELFAGLSAGSINAMRDDIASIGKAVADLGAHKPPITTPGPLVEVTAAATYVVTLSENVTVTLAGLSPGERVDILFVQNAAGAHAVSWLGGEIDWQEGSDGEVSPDPGRATSVVLHSLGGGRWLGRKSVHGREGASIAVLWNNELSGAYVALYQANGTLLRTVPLGYAISSMADVHLTASGQYAAVAVQDKLYNNRLISIKVSDGSIREAVGPFVRSGPTWVRLALRGDMLYGIDDASLQVFEFNVVTGTRSNLFELPGVPQSVAAGPGELTFGWHNVMGPMTPDPMALTTTYDTATRALAATQFPLPEGASAFSAGGIVVNPSAAGGAYSPDGSLYALFCAVIQDDDGAGSILPRATLVVYDATTKEIAWQTDLSGVDVGSLWYCNPTWSPDGRIVISGDNRNLISADVQAQTYAVHTAGDTGLGLSSYDLLAISSNGAVIEAGSLSTVRSFSVASGLKGVLPLTLDGVPGESVALGVGVRG